LNQLGRRGQNFLKSYELAPMNSVGARRVGGGLPEGGDMDHRDVLAYLKGLCEDLDEGRKPRRFQWTRSLVLPVAVPAVLGLGGLTLQGCRDDGDDGDDGSGEVCDNRIDDDGDEFVDCGDEDCHTSALCVALYGAPIEDDCTDQVDNDGDLDVDCADADCRDDVACAAVALYGVMMEEDCTDNVDNDGDQAADCLDSDCYNHPNCMAMPAYGVPFEDCTDGADNDFDQDVDCADADCAGNPACPAE
jgi:hypothetical protein